MRAKYRKRSIFFIIHVYGHFFLPIFHSFSSVLDSEMCLALPLSFGLISITYLAFSWKKFWNKCVRVGVHKMNYVYPCFFNDYVCHYILCLIHIRYTYDWNVLFYILFFSIFSAARISMENCNWCEWNKWHTHTHSKRIAKVTRRLYHAATVLIADSAVYIIL